MSLLPAARIHLGNTTHQPKKTDEVLKRIADAHPMRTFKRLRPEIIFGIAAVVSAICLRNNLKIGIPTAGLFTLAAIASFWACRHVSEAHQIRQKINDIFEKDKGMFCVLVFPAERFFMKESIICSRNDDRFNTPARPEFIKALANGGLAEFTKYETENAITGNGANLPIKMEKSKVSENQKKIGCSEALLLMDEEILEVLPDNEPTKIKSAPNLGKIGVSLFPNDSGNS